MWVSFRRRNIPVLRNSLARCNARHLRIKHLVQFILVDPVCNNALTNRAALLCRALRRVNRLCSSTVSGTANMSRHGSTLCSPTVDKLLCRSLFSERSHVGNLRQTLQRKRGDSQEGGNLGVYPLAFAPGRREPFPPSADGEIPARTEHTALRIVYTRQRVPNNTKTLSISEK